MSTQHEFMAGLVRAAEARPATIQLDAVETLHFYESRKLWSEYNLKFRSTEGEMVELDLPSFPLPTRTNTTEEYEIEGKAVIPAFPFHGIVHFFMKRRGMNLIPRLSKQTNKEES